MSKANSTVVLTCCAVVLGALGLHAEIRLPSLLSDGMVLQQGTKVNIWGSGDPGEGVTISFKDQRASTVADSGGLWKAKIGPLEAGGPFTMTISGKNTITLHDVLVGEVWVCSGQSNMEMPVGITPDHLHHWSTGVNNYQQEVANGDYPRLRLFTVPLAVAAKPQRQVGGYWVAARPQTVNDFSAVGYFFGRDLLKVLNVPVGMIHASWGGTPAEAWTSLDTLATDPAFGSIVDSSKREPFSAELKALHAPYPGVFEDFEQQLAQWRKASDQAESEGTPVPPPPSIPADPRQNSWRPSGLFNGMIMPLTPYAIRGAIWYQGEANTDRPQQYRKLLPAMIGDWRRAWGEGDFPFLFVQLPNFGYIVPPYSFPGLREAELMTLSVPRTGMAVTIDIGEGSDIHPRNKQEVGYRLALAAQAIAYGRDVAYSGPLYRSMAIEGNKIRLRFDHAYNGLTAVNSTGSVLREFVIAGADRKFLMADAKIENDTVVVHSDEVEHPVAVRYAWAANPLGCNLYNRAGLPASPFRTDDWPDAFSPGR
jgi:sialate O-acetylesterase